MARCSSHADKRWFGRPQPTPMWSHDDVCPVRCSSPAVGLSAHERSRFALHMRLCLFAWVFLSSIPVPENEEFCVLSGQCWMCLTNSLLACCCQAPTTAGALKATSTKYQFVEWLSVGQPINTLALLLRADILPSHWSQTAAVEQGTHSAKMLSQDLVLAADMP